MEIDGRTMRMLAALADEGWSGPDGFADGEGRGDGGSGEWQSFVEDIRTSIWEEADDIAARVLSLRLVGALDEL